jgi:ribosomal protein S27AE
MRKCTKCGEIKEIAEFNRDPKGRDGRSLHCKPCRCAATLTWRRANAGEINERRRRRYAENPETHRRRTRSYAASHREPIRQRARIWYAENRARANANSQRWADEHPEEARLIRKACKRIRKALDSGEIAKPSACEWCGETSMKIQAAHHDYARPLDVRWLCVSCHVTWDKNHPKLIVRPDPLGRRRRVSERAVSS